MMNDILEQLSECAEVETGRSFRNLTTFKIGGDVKYVIYPNSSFGLTSVLNVLNKNQIPFKVLGNGSNILCSDDNYDGAVIKLTRGLNQLYRDGNVLVVEAGYSIIALAYKALEYGLSGLEFASGIPGTVGGCIFMNAGAYKSNMSDIVEEVQVLIDDELIWLSNQQCEFGYRHSVFSQHPDWIIVAAKIRLQPHDPDAIRELMENRKARRHSSQPLDKPSAGSTFRNFEDTAAWKLIDEIGYRGKKIGDAAVSEKHSNFIVNLGNAKATDVIALTDEIKEKVYDQFGLEMIMEVEKFNWNKK